MILLCNFSFYQPLLRKMKQEKFGKIIAIKDKLFRLAFSIMGNREDAEDVVQDAMLRVWDKRGAWNAIDNLEGYCMRAVRNISLDKLALKGNQCEDLSDSDAKTESIVHPDEIMEKDEQLGLIYQLIDRLPEKQKTIMQLRDVEGMSYKEIAGVMQITEEQVKIILFRARQKVKEYFKKINHYGLSTN